MYLKQGSKLTNHFPLYQFIKKKKKKKKKDLELNPTSI